MAIFAVSRPDSAKKRKKKCPFSARRKEGKWTISACILPADATCPDPGCPVNPHRQEPDTNAKE